MVKSLPLKVRSLLKRKKIIFFATSSKKGEPNLVAVESLGLLLNDKILISNCMMKKTLKNLNENKTASICVTDNKDYFQIKGMANYYKEGKWFNLVKRMLESEPYKPKGAILLTIKKVYDLDKAKRIV